MRWIVASLLIVSLAGCGGLERKSYPASGATNRLVGTVAHVQPYTGEASESNWSRAGWGLLAGGIVASAFAGLSESDIGDVDAYSYIVKPVSSEDPQLINAYNFVPKGACVAVYDSVSQGMMSIEMLAPDSCR
ncbi:hypothetical protein [Modicisalibacter coralii]|uniref:hypothetical protein n=1 Tax=Modicisalibacter coralii TaxID=2304602 RepID=UPI00100BF191|nr:hypothetical protein [Halomonas coralii]